MTWLSWRTWWRKTQRPSQREMRLERPRFITLPRGATSPWSNSSPLSWIRRVGIDLQLNSSTFTSHLNWAAFAVLLITYIWEVFGSTSCSTSRINSCDDQGNVPLHCAVEKNKVESCRALLDLGADPNILNVALMAPLHLAVSLEHNNLVEVRQPGNEVSGCFI